MNGSWVKWVAGTLAPMMAAMFIWVGSINTKVSANEEATKKIEKIKEDIAKIDERTKIILEELRKR
jgi:hypothetical protein